MNIKAFQAGLPECQTANKMHLENVYSSSAHLSINHILPNNLIRQYIVIHSVKALSTSFVNVYYETNYSTTRPITTNSNFLNKNATSLRVNYQAW
jgi:hypothetical protein